MNLPSGASRYLRYGAFPGGRIKPVEPNTRKDVASGDESRNHLYINHDAWKVSSNNDRPDVIIMRDVHIVSPYLSLERGEGLRNLLPTGLD